MPCWGSWARHRGRIRHIRPTRSVFEKVEIYTEQRWELRFWWKKMHYQHRDCLPSPLRLLTAQINYSPKRLRQRSAVPPAVLPGLPLRAPPASRGRGDLPGCFRLHRGPGDQRWRWGESPPARFSRFPLEDCPRSSFVSDCTGVMSTKRNSKFEFFLVSKVCSQFSCAPPDYSEREPLIRAFAGAP